jgi:RsiW-degrading membrane proteinase PrsW (M82 family)
MKSDSTSKRDQLGWRMPIYAALPAVLVFLPVLISSNTDVLYLFVIVPALVLIGICVLIYAATRKNLPIAVTVATFCAVSAVAFLYDFQIRTFTRWSLWSGQYKNNSIRKVAPSCRVPI